MVWISLSPYPNCLTTPLVHSSIVKHEKETYLLAVKAVDTYPKFNDTISILSYSRLKATEKYLLNNFVLPYTYVYINGLMQLCDDIFSISDFFSLQSI